MISQEILNNFKTSLNKRLLDFCSRGKVYALKSDNSIVTEIDLYVSNYFKNYLSNDREFSNYTYFSEEDHKSLTFPAFIIDPIDGTKELAQGIPECAVSIGIFENSSISNINNWGWLYNPFTNFELNTDNYTEQMDVNCNKSNKQLLGLVSRTEWDKGLYRFEVDAKIILAPKGSIAFKLGLLASGGCDFVITKQPKNIWDIAGGTILCNKRGFNLYIDGKKISKLEIKRYPENMIWCKEENFPFLWNELF